MVFLFATIEKKDIHMNLLNRFLEYVKIDTQSDADSSTIPSTSKQFNLLNLLKKQLQDLGVKDIRLDPTGNLYATIPSNVKGKAPSIGLMAHVDTASEMSGANVKPNVIQDYDGQKILLNQESNIYLDPKVFPSLKKQRGKTIVTTDGTTLLGADDKAGVAIIMTLVESVMKQPFSHGPIQIGFTSDEDEEWFTLIRNNLRLTLLIPLMAGQLMNLTMKILMLRVPWSKFKEKRFILALPRIKWSILKRSLPHSI